MSNRFSKKVRIMCLIAALAVMLTACGDKSVSTVSVNGDYAPSKNLNLTVWNAQGSDFVPTTGASNNIPAKWLEQKSMVKVENIFGNGGGQWDGLLSRLVAGNNLPDIFTVSGNQGPAHFAKLDEIGQVWELTPEMLQKYAPNVWNRIPQSAWEAIRVNGKILGIPYMLASLNDTAMPFMSEEELAYAESLRKPVSDVLEGLWIRDDISKTLYPDSMSWDDISALLEEKQAPIGDYLMDIPVNSIDKFIKLFSNIKEMKLTSNNNPVYPFGYTGADNFIPFSYLGAQMFGYEYHTYFSSWNSKTEEMRLPITEPIMRQTAKTINQMLRDKIIDPESLVQSDAIFKERALNGEYAVVVSDNIGLDIVDFNKQLEIAGKPFRYRPFFTDVPAAEGYEPYRVIHHWGSSMAILKTLNEGQLIQVLNWVNIQFSDEFEEILWWGTKEAALYTEDADGKRRYKDERFNTRYIDGDAAALDITESLGLGNNGGQLYILFNAPSLVQACRWNPRIMWRSSNITLSSSMAFAFPADSPHVTSVAVFPPCYAWSPNFAEITELVKYWAERGQWEQMFTKALAADSDTSFDARWDAALENLNSIVDLDEMCKKMTEVARKDNEILKTAVY